MKAENQGWGKNTGTQNDEGKMTQEDKTKK